MQELVFVSAYIVCAFMPVLTLKAIRKNFSQRLFWTSWIVSLTGAFVGGVFGTVAMHRLGFDLGYAAGVISAIIGSWALAGLFLSLVR